MVERVFHMYINGEICTGNQVIKIYSPINNEVMGECPIATYKDCDNAVQSAATVYTNLLWNEESRIKRIEQVEVLIQLIEKNLETIAEIEALNIGILREFAKANLQEAVTNSKNYIDNIKAESIETKITNNYADDSTSVIRYEPYGVCLIILPWNYPFDIMINKIIPALLTGNSLVIKPSLIAPCSVMFLSDLLNKCGFLPGTVNILAGDDKIGKYLADNPVVKLISFTGSTSVGQDIYRRCASDFKKVILECGGNSPTIVLKSVKDYKKIAESIIISILSHGGQVCVASRQIFIHESIYDILVKNLVGRMRFTEYIEDIDQNYKLFPLEPIIGEEQIDTIDNQVKQSLREGANLLFGGEIKKGASGQFYYKPTILEGVTPKMSAYYTEIFGPVLMVFKFKDEKELTDMVNLSHYGLTATIWGDNDEQCLTISRLLQTGSVYINTTPFESHNDNGPFGGCKLSGIGREHGLIGIHEYQQVKFLLSKN